PHVFSYNVHQPLIRTMESSCFSDGFVCLRWLSRVCCCHEGYVTYLCRSSTRCSRWGRSRSARCWKRCDRCFFYVGDHYDEQYSSGYPCLCWWGNVWDFDCLFNDLQWHHDRRACGFILVSRRILCILGLHRSP